MRPRSSYGYAYLKPGWSPVFTRTSFTKGTFQREYLVLAGRDLVRWLVVISPRPPYSIRT